MTTPTKNVIGLLLIGLTLFGACKPSETLPADQVALQPNESAQIGDITVRLDSLRGQGCPTCLFAYNAFVSAVISNTTAQQRVTLVLYSYSSGSHSDSTGVTLAGQTYKVILRDVTPRPPLDITKTQPGGSKAIIQVTRL